MLATTMVLLRVLIIRASCPRFSIMTGSGLGGGSGKREKVPVIAKSAFVRKSPLKVVTTIGTGDEDEDTVLLH